MVSALVHPFFLAAVIYGLAAGTLWPNGAGAGAQVFLFALQSVVLLMGYLVMMLIAARACGRCAGWPGSRRSIPTMPIYWLLISVAGWYAVWQLLTAPFYWEKPSTGAKPQQEAPARLERTGVVGLEVLRKL